MLPLHRRDGQPALTAGALEAPLRAAAHAPGGMHRFRRAWCALMHNSLTWPMHGKYVCRRCGIVYTVPWRRNDEEMAE